MTADGFDEALVGIAERCGERPLAVYDYGRAVELLVARDGGTVLEAQEYLDVNCLGAWVGPGTPLWLRRPDG